MLLYADYCGYFFLYRLIISLGTTDQSPDRRRPIVSGEDRQVVFVDDRRLIVMTTAYKNLDETRSGDDDLPPSTHQLSSSAPKSLMMTIDEDGQGSRILQSSQFPVPEHGGRKLSIPFSEQRRKSSFGHYNRSVLCAVDMSDNARDAFNCEHDLHRHIASRRGAISPSRPQPETSDSC